MTQFCVTGELLQLKFGKRGITVFGDGYFDGHEIKVVYGATGRRDRFEFYYGGHGMPDGPGHGHVVSNDGVNIHYWREPHANIPVIDDRWSTEQLSAHGL